MGPSTAASSPATSPSAGTRRATSTSWTRSNCSGRATPVDQLVDERSGRAAGAHVPAAWPRRSSSNYVTENHTSPVTSPRVGRISQHPTLGNLNSLPHSSPSRFQSDPVCCMRPRGSSCTPPAFAAARLKPPSPVVLHTIFAHLPARSGKLANTRAHRDPPSIAPCTSVNGPLFQRCPGEGV